MTRALTPAQVAELTRPRGTTVAAMWGTKTWGAAQRAYLAKHGQKSDAAVPPKHLSPMGRMMARSLPTPKD